MFAKIDLDGNGTIDYTEFLMAAVNQKKLLTDERLQMAFEMFDKPCQPTLEELQTFLCGTAAH